MRRCRLRARVACWELRGCSFGLWSWLHRTFAARQDRGKVFRGRKRRKCCTQTSSYFAPRNGGARLATLVRAVDGERARVRRQCFRRPLRLDVKGNIAASRYVHDWRLKVQIRVGVGTEEQAAFTITAIDEPAAHDDAVDHASPHQ